MNRFKLRLKFHHKKLPAALLVPLYGVFSILLIFGLYCLNGFSMLIDSTAYTTSSQAVEQNTSETDFNAYLQKLFQSEVTANTLNLHYTLADPASAEISQYPVTLGEISSGNEASQLASLENIKNELQTYDTSSMPISCQLAYDVLEDSITRSLELAPYYYYDELLSSANGVQSEYPILLAEYAFHTKNDVEEYLALLSQYDTYFHQVCDFEKEKAKRGLFMNKTAVDNLIEQCRAFLPDKSEKSLWETTFSERLNEIDSLTKKEKKSYIARNKEALQEHVYPAYHNLIAVLKALRTKGNNAQGLCYFEDGQKYYELLVKSTTGSRRSIPELEKMVETQRDKNLTELSLLTSSLTDNNSAADNGNNKSTDNNNSSADNESSKSAADNNPARNNNADKPASGASYNILPYKTPEDMLEHLKTQIQDAFPAVPSSGYTIKNVSKKLQGFLAPAFYLTAPIDKFTENCIYINPGSNYNDIELFTTLAHEGYPGHLYQTVYSYSAGLAPIRCLLYHGGYTEGWATYVEMLSYNYAGLNQNAARALMLNQDATLSLYASIDMGVHYDGWSLADTADFLGTYGIADSSVISNIYQAVIENPANYLKYYIGYLEFLELKAQAKKYYGNDFSDLLFHKAVLDIGSAPFYIIEKYLVKYYNTAY